MNFTSFKQAVTEEAARRGLDQYELYYESSSDTSVSAFRGEINEFSSSSGGGVCFRCTVDGKMGYASTEAMNPEEAVSVVERAISNARSLETDDPVFLQQAGLTYQKSEAVSYALSSTADLVKIALDGQKALQEEDPCVTDNSSARAFSSENRIAICNSNGLDLSYENRVSGFMAMPVVTDGTEKTNSFEMKLGDLKALDLNEVVQKAVSSAKAKLGAGTAPTMQCPVIFSSGAMASLLQTYSDIFSSESTQKGLSLLAGKEGTAIASEAVSLTDDPFYKDSAMPIGFDAEGSPASPKKVIDRGTLTTLLYNMKTAAIAGRTTTGNASKAGYDSPIGIRPFTMYLEPGTLTEDELIARAGNGIYINSLGGLHAGANVISGDFSLQSAGFLIENGVKTQPVKAFTVAGNFYDLLKKITDLSDTVELPRAGGITSFGSPAVLVSELSIAGK